MGIVSNSRRVFVSVTADFDRYSYNNPPLFFNSTLVIFCFLFLLFALLFAILLASFAVLFHCAGDYKRWKWRSSLLERFGELYILCNLEESGGVVFSWEEG
jgi:hypothetical protein